MAKKTITSRAKEAIRVELTTPGVDSASILRALDDAGLILVDFDEQDALIEERDNLKEERDNLKLAMESGYWEILGTHAVVERVEITPGLFVERDAAGNIASLEAIP